jgi:hypothetical protein
MVIIFRNKGGTALFGRGGWSIKHYPEKTTGARLTGQVFEPEEEEFFFIKNTTSFHIKSAFIYRIYIYTN